MIIHVDGRLMGNESSEPVAFVLERMLPGQRAAAGEWFLFMKELLSGARMEGFVKEPTLFVNKDPENKTKLILHADDGLLGATKAEREKLIEKLSEHVEVKVSDVLTKHGGEVEFLKRRYVGTEAGVYMFSNAKHAEGLIEAVGDHVKEKDTPADQSFLEPDETQALSTEKAKIFKECVGRLLYLSHSRPDLQFATCVLSSKMSQPTQGSWKWLLKTVGYLVKVPSLGFLIKPIRDGACFGWNGARALETGGTIVIESVTDSDWAGCKRSRRSKSSIQIFVGGSLVTSVVRTQRSISLSSGEAEFVAMVGGACESRYVKDCLEYMVKGAY